MLDCITAISFTKLKGEDLNQRQICMFSEIVGSEEVKRMKIFYKQNHMVFKFKFLLGIMSNELKYSMTLKH